MRFAASSRVASAAVLAAVAVLCAASATSAQDPAEGPIASADEPTASTASAEEQQAASDDADGEATTSTSTRYRLGDRVLREGMRGSDVRELQTVLTELNFDTRVDGVFGTKTKRNVRRYEHWKETRINAVVHIPQADRMQSLVRDGVRYRNHVFPVRGRHDYGGSGSRFGAPRSGHTHMGQDITAAEGTRLVAVHEGRVTAREYQAGGAGHYLVIRGRDGSDSVYMHLAERARVAPDEKVMAGERIGRVGSTGSSTGPHLHFELWTPHWYDGGQAYDPLRKLRRWDERT